MKIHKPTIEDFTSAQHDHTSEAEGGIVFGTSGYSGISGYSGKSGYSSPRTSAFLSTKFYKK